jgi:hypothetical protein
VKLVAPDSGAFAYASIGTLLEVGYDVLEDGM